MSVVGRIRARRGRRRGGFAAGPIGLELGARALHLLQLESGPEGLRIRAAASLEYPEGREAAVACAGGLRRLVRAALRRRPFRGQRVVSALCASEVKLMVMSCAAAPGRAEPERILRLVEERVSEPLERLVVDYLPIRMIGEKEEEVSALVAVASREAVIAHLERLRLAGLEIGALEIAPVAIRRLVSQATSARPDENVLVLYCGRDRGHLTVLWGRRLILYRELDYGEDRAVEDLGKALEMAPDAAAELLYRYGACPPGPGDPAVEDPAWTLEVSQTLMEILKPGFYELAEQIGKAMVYVASKSRGASPDRVYLVGALSRWPRAERLLEGLISIPVCSLDPRELFALGPGAGASADLEESPELALVAGLALRGLRDDE